MRKDKPTSQERIEHILEAIEKIERFSRSHHQRESFLADEKTISACLYQYTIIGEAVANIDGDILEKYNYPWHKVRAFRNFILPEYHGIEMRIVWDTTFNLLPDLKELMGRMLKNEF